MHPVVHYTPRLSFSPKPLVSAVSLRPFIRVLTDVALPASASFFLLQILDKMLKTVVVLTTLPITTNPVRARAASEYTGTYDTWRI